MRLSSLLTKDRKKLPSAYLKDEGLRRAYVLYFLPSNIYKIHKPLAELYLHPNKPIEKERLRILDIGTGPGTAILGTIDFFSKRKQQPFLEFTAVDAVGENLREAERLFKDYNDPQKASLFTLKSAVEDLVTVIKGRYDLIIMSNLLNELASGDVDRILKRTSILKELGDRFLAPDGSFIIIEPALRETSRDLLAVRDGIAGHGFNIYSPCLSCEKCPALINPNDWCHEEVSWDPPSLIKEIDKLTGLRKDSMKMSYMVVRKDGLSLADMLSSHAYRVVSESLATKGKKEFYVCGSSRRRLITCLDKDQSSLNEAFQQLGRGDLISVESLRDEEKRLRVVKDTFVKSYSLDKL